LAVVVVQDAKLVDENAEEIKNENKKRDEEDEKQLMVSEQMKEDLILLTAIILILCLTCSIVGAKVVQP
jgi:hypothetical protein